MRFYTVRLAAVVVSGCLGASHAEAQTPSLSRQQRELLGAILAAVDAGQSLPVTADVAWPTHVMRASDGSHYVAFTIESTPEAPLPPGPALLYVRLATSQPQAVQRTERSVIRDWLTGQRVDPRLLPGRGIAIGEMPAFGAGAIGVRGSTPTTGSMDLKLMALERERARQEQETRDKKRQAELEGRVEVVRELFPFEDFDVASRSVRADGTRIVSRAFTAGPGNYDLYVAWADTSSAKPAATVRVLRRTLQLPAAGATGLAASSIILADAVKVRAAPYPPTEQAAHPYSIGLMEIVPAQDALFTRDESLSVAFQIINARPSDAGLPDLAVAFRIVRVTGDREAPVASLNPQQYNAETMPLGFDLRQGHPVFAAVSAPLASLGRGAYRLKVLINDRLAGSSATAEADFVLVGTPASLLAEAPALGRPFSRDVALDPASLAAVLDALAPATASPQLARALAVARTGRLIDLLVEEPVPPSEAGIRTTLTGLALLSVGDGSAAVQFQRALQLNVPAAPVYYLTGAARALQNRDPDAIAAWQAALDTGHAPPVTGQLLVEAFLRRGDSQRAAASVAGLSSTPPGPGWTRTVAATHIASGRYADAVSLLDTHLDANPDDGDAMWLRVHALYADVVKGGGRDRFMTEARRYVDGKGAHAALVGEWLRAIS